MTKMSDLKAKHEVEMSKLQDSYNQLQGENEGLLELVDSRQKEFEQQLQELENQRQEAKAQGYKFRSDWEAANDSCARMEVTLGASNNSMKHAVDRIAELENECRHLKAVVRGETENDD